MPDHLAAFHLRERLNTIANIIWVGGGLLVNKLGSILRKSWQLLVAASALSLLTVWTVEQIVVARGFQIFQENLYRHAAHLADGKQKAVVLGSMIMMGGTNPIIRETARGSLKPDNPQAIALMKHLHQSFGLGNIRIVDSTGVGGGVNPRKSGAV